MSVCKPVVGDGMAVGFGRWVNESRFHVVPLLFCCVCVAGLIDHVAHKSLDSSLRIRKEQQPA